jgi:hypothetical protein
VVRPGEDGKRAGARLFTCGTRGTADDHSCGWPDHRVDLGAGSWRRAAIFLGQEGHQLLRTVWRGEKFGQYHHAHATVETTQRTSADGSDRDGKNGAAKQPRLAMVYEQEKQKGNANSATLAVARKMVAYLVAVVIRQQSMNLAVRFVADRVNLRTKLLPPRFRILIEQCLYLIVVFVKQRADLLLLFRSQLQVFRKLRKFLVD